MQNESVDCPRGLLQLMLFARNKFLKKHLLDKTFMNSFFRNPIEGKLHLVDNLKFLIYMEETMQSN